MVIRRFKTKKRIRYKGLHRRRRVRCHESLCLGKIPRVSPSTETLNVNNMKGTNLVFYTGTPTPSIIEVFLQTTERQDTDTGESPEIETTIFYLSLVTRRENVYYSRISTYTHFCFNLPRVPLLLT